MDLTRIPHLTAVTFALGILLFLLTAASTRAQTTVYSNVKALKLAGAKSEVNNLVFERDRVKMTFTGTFYFTAPVEGRVTGAVFIGQGTLLAVAPSTPFERSNLKRFLGVEHAVESDFKTAVLRFSDESMNVIGNNRSEGAVPPQAQEIASTIDARILKETGANLAARIAVSILNEEAGGFFFANFDGGRRGRFSYILDQQSRIPTDYFGINAGERGLIFKYQSDDNDNDVWLAFYSLSDYARGMATYSDLNNPVDIDHYDMDIDVRDPTKGLGLTTKIKMRSRFAGLRAITFTIGNSLGEYDKVRLKKQMRVTAARLDGSTPVDFVQEDWEGAFTVFLPKAMEADQPFTLELALKGDFLRQPDLFPDCSYPLSNDSWYPQQGYLDRATYSFVFHHRKNRLIASTGVRVSEEPDPADKNLVITKYVMNYPVALQTFALGPFQRHRSSIKWESGDKPTPLEFNSLSGDQGLALKESFVMTELNNAARNFSYFFGRYPYDSFGAVYHPYGFGQGFATMLTIPNTDRASKYAFSFMAHETAHQWWGNIVSWRSYRDQWLSEGFAEYSGVIYTGRRDSPKAADQLVSDMRESLRNPPETSSGRGNGRLDDVGPLILGHRLETRKTYGAYSALVYNKGALVLRMIHFLMTDPSTGNGQPFYEMMRDFVNRYRDKVASTDDFRAVVNEHFAKTPLAARYGTKNLDWFFQQWVYATGLPTYKMEYQAQDQPDGSCVVTGTISQENVPDSWFMLLPVVFKLGSGKMAYSSVAANGPKTPFKMRLPVHPERIELDPQHWVLSEKTSTK